MAWVSFLSCGRQPCRAAKMGCCQMAKTKWAEWRFYRRYLRALPVMTAVGIAALAVGMLAESAAVAQGVRRGLEVCAGVLIPSLFPFMALCGFLSITDYARILSIPLTPLTTRVFKLPKELGVVVLLSLVGGYPVGAKMIASLLEQRRISRETAERMLCFCVNSGPSFLITAVGAGLFLNRTVGVILFATQTAATLLIGWIVSLRVPMPTGKAAPPAGQSAGPAVVAAVSGAIGAMLAMCAFAVLFSGLLALLGTSGASAWLAAVLRVDQAVVAAVMSGFLEVTAGCIAASGIGGTAGFALVSAMVSFGGLSVLFQIVSCFDGQPVRFRPLLLARCAHMGISTAMAVPLYRLLCADQATWLSAQPPALHTDSRTTLLSVCLLGMSAIFTLSIEKISCSKNPLRNR